MTDTLQFHDATSSNLAAAASFLNEIAGAGLVQVGALTESAGMKGRTFCPSKENGELRAFLEAEQKAHANLYFTLNSPVPPSRQTGRNGALAKTDIATLRGVTIDLDPVKQIEIDEGATGFERERDRLKGIASTLVTGPCPPSLIIDSGSGMQAHWLFQAPLPATAENIDAVEQQARGLIKLYGAGSDTVQSVQHLFRVPHTTNYPDARKLKRGRTVRFASVWHYSKARYTLADLAAYAPPVADSATPKAKTAKAVNGKADPAGNPLGLDVAAIWAVIGKPALLPAEARAEIDRARALKVNRDLDERLTTPPAKDHDRSHHDYAVACALLRSRVDQQATAMAVAAYSPGKVRDQWPAYLIKHTMPKAVADTDVAGKYFQPIDDDEDYAPPPPADDDDEDYTPPPPSDFSPSDFAFESDEEGDLPRTWTTTLAREISPTAIEPREWLYGKFLIRRRVALTVAPSETGKTGVGIVDALAIAAGKPLLGIQPFGALRVAVWNGEDPLEELERRVAATMQHYKLTWEDIGGRLRLDSGFGKDGIEMEIAASNRSGLLMNQPQIRAFTQTILADKTDVQFLDPFVSTHGVGENDNNAIDRVAKTFAHVADETNSAVSLFHHTRKSGGSGNHDMTVDDARGAGSLGAAVRARRAFQTMQVEEAREHRVEPKRRKFYFRVADSGNNMAAPDEDTMWFEMRNVLLPNGRPTPGRPGDEIGVPVRWRPEITAILPPEVIDRILTEVDTGVWRDCGAQSPFWIGHLIAREHGLNGSDPEVRKFIKRTIAKMMSEKLLTTVFGKNEQRRMTIFYARGKGPNATV